MKSPVTEAQVASICALLGPQWAVFLEQIQIPEKPDMSTQHPADAMRIELVNAIRDLASNFENSLYAFGQDAEARKKAEGDIAYAMRIAAKHNQNGAVFATTRAPEPVDPVLVVGAIYESKHHGKVIYKGLDSYWGETTHEFDLTTSGYSKRYVKFGSVREFLAPPAPRPL